jgi:dihydroceramide fatty acyl 2-hydroxylase
VRHPVFTDELLEAAEGADRPGPPRPLRWFHPGFLERLTRAPWWSPYAVWSPVLLLLGVSAGPLGTTGITSRLLAGVLGWTWVEYVLHRWIFHFPPTAAVRRVVTFTLHRHHHRDPQGLDRLVATPAEAAGLLVPAAWALQRVDPAGHAWVSAGLILGYLLYELAHLSAHHGVARAPLLRWLRRHHLRHHFDNAGSNFGISSPLWDAVFGTLRRRPPGVEAAPWEGKHL